MSPKPEEWRLDEWLCNPHLEGLIFFMIAARAPAPSLVWEPLMCPKLAFAAWPLGHLLGSATSVSPTNCAKTGRTAEDFATQGSTHQFWRKQEGNTPKTHGCENF